MPLTIKEEHYSESFREELGELFAQHWEEIATYKDIPLSVDWDIYKSLDSTGKLLTLTARNGEELVGYVVYILTNHPHYKDTFYAQQDILFVRKGERKSFLGVGLKLLRVSEDYLSNLGVEIIQHHVKTEHDFSPFLEKLGYTFVEKIYQKRLV